MKSKKKKYIKPNVEVIKVESTSILKGSDGGLCPICGKPGNHYGHHKNDEDNNYDLND